MIKTTDSQNLIERLDLKKQQFEEALASMKLSLKQDGSLSNLIQSHPPYALLAECFLMGFSLRERIVKAKESPPQS